MGRKKLNNIVIIDDEKKPDTIIQNTINQIVDNSITLDTTKPIKKPKISKKLDITISADSSSNISNDTSTSTSTEIKSTNSTNSSNSTNTVDLSNNEDIIDINELRGKEVYHYKMLDNFFSSCDIAQIERMVDIINGNHLISLRFLDWFVTRYCYLYKLSINIANKYTKENNFNINISYKAQLKSFKKKYFDPFRRKMKFYFTTDDLKKSDTNTKPNIVLLTTLGQLNFFRWAITYDLINYTETNYRTIITKIEHVNTYFRKNSVIDNMNLNKNKSILLKSSSDSTNDSNDSNDSTNNSNESEKDIINSIYNSNTKSNIQISISNKKSKDYKIPQVCRNIMLEL